MVIAGPLLLEMFLRVERSKRMEKEETCPYTEEVRMRERHTYSQDDIPLSYN